MNGGSSSKRVRRLPCVTAGPARRHSYRAKSSSGCQKIAKPKGDFFLVGEKRAIRQLLCQPIDVDFVSILRGPHDNVLRRSDLCQPYLAVPGACALRGNLAPAANHFLAPYTTGETR